MTALDSSKACCHASGLVRPSSNTISPSSSFSFNSPLTRATTPARSTLLGRPGLGLGLGLEAVSVNPAVVTDVGDNSPFGVFWPVVAAVGAEVLDGPMNVYRSASLSRVSSAM